MSKAREIIDEEGTSMLWNVGMAVKSAGGRAPRFSDFQIIFD